MTERNLRRIQIDEDSAIEMVGEQNLSEKLIPWYLINKNKAFCKLWDQLIMYIVIYTLFVCPYIMAFGEEIVPPDSS